MYGLLVAVQDKPGTPSAPLLPSRRPAVFSSPLFLPFSNANKSGDIESTPFLLTRILTFMYANAK